MKITTKGRYGIRTMIILALHYRKSPIPVRYISKREKISADYIEQLFIRLKRWGLIKSIRGPGGGFILAKSPSNISIGDILRCVGESITLAPCILTGNKNSYNCPLCDKCVTRQFFKQVTTKVKGMMDSISLSDLCKNSKEL